MPCHSTKKIAFKFLVASDCFHWILLMKCWRPSSRTVRTLVFFRFNFSWWVFHESVQRIWKMNSLFQHLFTHMHNFFCTFSTMICSSVEEGNGNNFYVKEKCKWIDKYCKRQLVIFLLFVVQSSAIATTIRLEYF